MTLVAVMNKYYISIHHAALLLNVPEQSIVCWLLETPMADYLEEVFLYEREKRLH